MGHQVTLAQMATALATELSTGKPGQNTRAVSAFLHNRPEAALDLIEMAAAESRKKRPSMKRISAYRTMVGEALRSARMAMEAGQREPADLIDSCRTLLMTLGQSGRITGFALIGVAAEFTNARIDPGAALRAVIDTVMRAEAEARPIDALGSDTTGAAATAELLDLLEQGTRQLGDDPFVVQSELQEQFGALPDEARAGMATMLLEASHPPLRECAPGWLLDNAPLVRRGVAEVLGLAAKAGRVSGSMLRRMIALRNWLPERERASLDTAIQLCRRAEVVITPLPRATVRKVLASIIDGAGAQTLAVMVQDGRHFAVGMILLKQRFGVRDAWVRGGMTQRKAGDFLSRLQEVDALPVSLDYVRTAVANGLAVQRGSNEMPPFGLLQVLELAGLDGVQPCVLPAEDILRQLENDADRESLLVRNRDLVLDFPVLESWFECDDSVAQALGQKKLSRSKSLSLIQEQVLPRHADSWVERLAWTALTLRGSEGAPWRELVASARALQAGRPIAEIPVMAHVAAMTVEAFRAQERAGRV